MLEVSDCQPVEVVVEPVPNVEFVKTLPVVVPAVVVVQVRSPRSLYVQVSALLGLIRKVVRVKTMSEIIKFVRRISYNATPNNNIDNREIHTLEPTFAFFLTRSLSLIFLFQLEFCLFLLAVL